MSHRTLSALALAILVGSTAAVTVQSSGQWPIPAWAGPPRSSAPLASTRCTGRPALT